MLACERKNRTLKFKWTSRHATELFPMNFLRTAKPHLNYNRRKCDSHAYKSLKFYASQRANANWASIYEVCFSLDKLLCTDASSKILIFWSKKRRREKCNVSGGRCRTCMHVLCSQIRLDSTFFTASMFIAREWISLPVQCVALVETCCESKIHFVWKSMLPHFSVSLWELWCLYYNHKWIWA